MLKNIIVENSYFDSATLMLLTNKIKEKLSLSSDSIAIMMATDMNKKIMKDSALLSDDGQKAHAGDMLIAIKTDLSVDEIKSLVDAVLSEKTKKKTSNDVVVHSVQEAVEHYEASNFAVVSLPGVYAAREVKKLLQADKHVLLFSDNVSIEDEIALKDLALSKDLLMMGPDCGTAIINGVGLGFSNKVERGSIGIVAASGTGLQEVATIISNNGGGISQAFGTGGRDIQEQVGGKMMLYCLKLLLQDPQTDSIVIVSKPPAASVVEKIKAQLKDAKKPVVACFLGAKKELLADSSLVYAETLEDAAVKALSLIGVAYKSSIDVYQLSLALSQRPQKTAQYIRALYCGGTLAYEALLMMEKAGLSVYSNLSKKAEKKLSSTDVSVQHTVLDMGDDDFTVGKPHPMIDPTLRSERFIHEGQDESVAVLIADIELGYGSSDDAAKILAKDIRAVYAKGKTPIVIAVICGSKQDYQGYDTQRQLLKEAGAIVVNSNAEAVLLALQIMARRGQDVNFGNEGA